jgi:predicted Zn-dependent peptidase
MKVTEIFNKHIDSSLYRGLSIVIFLGISTVVNSQTIPISPSDSLELDSSIRYGRLTNGFTYYIKELSEPQPKLYMNLYTKAGSDHSGKNEPNVAHAVEHLAYKATKNFPEGINHSEIVNELGMNIYDFQAVTSTKLTEYFFDAPAHNPKAMKTGLLFFRDIADGLLMKDENIISVKGELRQEYLLKTEDKAKTDATVKLVSRIYPCSQDSSNFLSKQEKMDPETLRNFYRDYYRPDLMAVSIIGNIKNIDELESKIKRAFSDLEVTDHPKKLKNCDSMYFNSPPNFHIVQREVEPSKVVPNEEVNFQLYYRDPETFFNLYNQQGIERLILTDLLADVLNLRFSEISKGYNDFSAFNLNLYNEDMLGGLLIEVEMKDFGVEETFKKIIKGILQLQKHGVSQEEFQKLKLKHSGLINSKSEKKPRYWRDQIVAHYIVGEALPKKKKQLQLDTLSDLSVNDFNEFIADFLSAGPHDIGIIVPIGSEAVVLEEDEVRSWIKEQQDSKVDPFIYSKLLKNLLLTNQEKNLKEDIQYKIKNKAPDIKEFYLENGLKLIVQEMKSAAKNDKGMIVINGFSKRGICEIPEEQIFSALYAPEIILNSGINNLSKLQVEKYLREKGLFPGVVSFYTGYNESGIQAFSQVDQIETILQLLYLYISKPNKNNGAFKEWQERKLQNLENLVINRFHEAVKEKTGDPKVIEDVFGKKVLSAGSKMNKGVIEIDLDEAFENFRHFFGNAEDFTFVVSGDFKMDSVTPLLVKYLGNLPADTSKAKKCAKKIEKNLPKGPKMFTIPVPPNFDLRNVKYGWKFLRSAGKSEDWREGLLVEVLAELTNIRGWDLRFKEGFAIYNVRVVGEFNKDLHRYEIRSYLDIAPEEYPAVKAAFHDIFKELKNELVSKEDLQKAIQYVISNRYKLDGGSKAIQKRNGMLTDHYRYGLPLTTPAEMKNYLQSLTSKDMRHFAKQLYQKKFLYEFEMKENDFN